VDRLRASRGTLAHADEHGLAEQPAHGRGPEGEAIEQEKVSRVRQQLDMLPAGQRVLLELAYYEGLTHVEIAALLRQPLGTVKTRIRLALLKLRDGFTADDARRPVHQPSPFTIALSHYLAARAAPTARARTLEGITAMVVDDDDDTLDLVRTVLESAGARVVTGSSAAAALARLQEAWPDVMVTDIRMPGGDGYLLAEKIQAIARASARTLPVVAFTGCDRADDVGRATRAEFAAYLVKPTAPRRVIETIAHVCGRSA
jgi:CheY-like chemotaxis protein